MTSNEPLVTVLVPVYNGAPFLRETLDSVLAQTLKDFELLVVDGGSKDGTLDILDSIKDSRLRVIAKQLNLVDSLNLGLEEARGKYIARMDADDIAETIRLERQVQYLEGHPEVVLAGSNATIIDADGNVQGRTYMPQASWWVEWSLFFTCAFINSSVIFSHRFMMEHGLRYGQVPAGDAPFHPLAHPFEPLRNPKNPFECEDYLLWVLISRRGQVCNLPGRQIRLRFHKASRSHVYDREMLTAASEISLWNVSHFLGCSVPRAEWWPESSDLVATTFRYWITHLTDSYVERKRLSPQQAAVIRQDAEFRIRLASGRPRNGVQRFWEAGSVLIKTTFPLVPDQWRSALQFVMGDAGYGRLKSRMRAFNGIRRNRHQA